MVHATADEGPAPIPGPAKIWTVKDPTFEGIRPVDNQGYAQSSAETAIVIDYGSSNVRAGWSFDHNPRISVPPIMARYRDRKLYRTFAFIGPDIYADGTAKGQAKSAYEPGSNVVSNWDVVEGVLDHVFLKLGVDGNGGSGYSGDGSSGGIGRPVVMTEPVANLGYSRRTMTEILFELYGAPSAAYGIDSLFSYNYNNGQSGLVISSSFTSTHLIPVLDKKPMLSHATRLNWGRCQSADYLLKLLRLKYPTFPSKLTEVQVESLVREHCYVSQDYEAELSRFLDWTGLEDRDHVIQFPFTEQVIVQKSEEELARQAEKRRENGRRLQEQAAKMRLEKLMGKEQEVEYYRELQAQIAAATTKKETKRLLETEEFDDESQLEKKIKELDKSIRKARNKDLGDAENEEEETPTFPLLDVPDDQLDDDGIKQKRHQRLLRSGYEARMRAKAEKAREKARIEEEERLDNEKRDNDREAWLDERRQSRLFIIQKIKDRERLKADLGNRKSLANQMRMKSIANLASDTPTKKRRRGGDEDTFGADDADWGVYRTIAAGDQSGDEEEEEDLDSNLRRVEAQLLEYDPDFTEENTRDAQTDWTKSLLHAFSRGPWPFDPESQREQHQLHLNVERIRVSEVVFQPSIAGLDQAGIVEIAANILTQRLVSYSPSQQKEILQDIFLTGGNTGFMGFEERLERELRATLPADTPPKLRKAGDVVLDAWRGAAEWAAGMEKVPGKKKDAFVTRAEYAEMGGEYIKEHNLGNIYSSM